MATETELATQEEILATCLRLELEAAALYRRFEAAAPDPELRALWATMAHEERYHARLIEDLTGRRGLEVPAVARDVLRAVVERVGAIQREADEVELDADRMLSITAALEFSEMDDLFDAVCRAAGIAPYVGRASHLRPLIEAVLERRSGDGVLRHLLAAMIRLRRRSAALGPVFDERDDGDDELAALARDH